MSDGVQATRGVIQPSSADQKALEQLAAVLSAVPASETFYLRGPDDGQLPLPLALNIALHEAIKILLQGDAIAISPLHRRLSTTEAGDLLGVSRQYLTRLVDRGDIPCDRTGWHRWLKLKEILDYKQTWDDSRQRVLDELTAEASALGAYE